MGVDLSKMIQLFSRGLEFSSTRDAYELDYGLVEIPFGRVSAPFLLLTTGDSAALLYCNYSERECLLLYTNCFRVRNVRS